MRQLEEDWYIPKEEIFTGQRAWYGKLSLTRSYKKSKDFLLPVPVTIRSKDFTAIDIISKKQVYCPSYFYGYEGWSFFKNKSDMILSWNLQVSNTILDIQYQAKEIRKAYSRGGYYYEQITRRGRSPEATGRMVNSEEMNDGHVRKFYFGSSRRVLFGTYLPSGIYGTYNAMYLSGHDIGDSLWNAYFPSLEDACFYYSKYAIPQVLELIDSWETTTTERIKKLYI